MVMLLRLSLSIGLAGLLALGPVGLCAVHCAARAPAMPATAGHCCPAAPSPQQPLRPSGDCCEQHLTAQTVKGERLHGEAEAIYVGSPSALLPEAPLSLRPPRPEHFAGPGRPLHVLKCVWRC
jgi:hypothetical protein